MKKLFKRSSSKKLKTGLDGSFANISVDGSPSGRPVSQISNYSGGSSYSLSNISIDSLGVGKGYVLAKKQKLPASCKAAWKGDVKKLKKALKKGDVNELDKDNRTPLHYAAAQGHNEVVSHLLSTGEVNFNIRDNEGKTPLLKCCECNQVTTAELLIQHDAFGEPLDINMADNDGNTPLLLATLHENIDLANLLVISDVDVNKANLTGETPLLAAARRNCLEIVELLGSEGVSLDTVDSEGHSALMVAVKSNHVSVVRYLLSLSPDTALKDKYGWTAFDFAQICPDNTCLRLMEEHDKKAENPEYNPEQDNLTTVNSQEEAANHRSSANDWTAPPDGELTEDENSFMSSPIELNGTTSPELLNQRSEEDIEVDIDAVLASDKSVSEVDLSFSGADPKTPKISPGASNRILENLLPDVSSDISEGQVEQPKTSPSTPGTDDDSVGQVLGYDDETSENLSSEDIGYFPTSPFMEKKHAQPTIPAERKDSLKAKLGFDLEEEESCTSQSLSQAQPPTAEDKASSPKRLPPTPRKDTSEGSTPKASPRAAGYDMDDESTLSSITEKTEPVMSPELGEVASPLGIGSPISPLPENTLSDSISLNSDIEISGYMTESVRSAASGRKSVSPKGETPSDFRMTPQVDRVPSDPISQGSASGRQTISSGVVSLKRTPPPTPPSARSTIADGVKRTPSRNSSVSSQKSGSSQTSEPKISPSEKSVPEPELSQKTESKVQFGSMFGGEESDSDSNEELEVFNKSAKSDKSDINDLSINSKSKSAMTDKNILNSARSSPNRLKPDFNKSSDSSHKKPRLDSESKHTSKALSINESIPTEMESDDEAEMLLAKSGEFLSTYATPAKTEASMKISVENNDVRVPAAFAPESARAVDSSFEQFVTPQEAKTKPPFEADVTMEDSSSDESETGKVAKKYLGGKSPYSRPQSSAYCSSVSPMEGEVLEQKSVPTSKQVTPRVSFGQAPICFTEPDRTSTPKKDPKEADDDEQPSSSRSHTVSVAAISSRFEDIERRKSEAERELEEIRRSRRSQSPVSASESLVTDSRNAPSERQRAASEESLVLSEEIPIDVKVQREVKRELEANPGVPPAERAEQSMTECASVLSEAVSYIQSNIENQNNPAISQLKDDLRETRQKLSKALDSKAKSDTLRKQMEIETEELRRKLEVVSGNRNKEEKSKMDMELELRSLQFKYEHESEEKANLETQYKTAKENLRNLETKHKNLLENFEKSGSSTKAQYVEMEKAQQKSRALESEIGDLKKMLEEEQKTRLIQEEMFNEQVNKGRELTTEASRNIRQKEDLLHQLTEAEEVCRNAENRNKTLINDLNNLRNKYETESKTWANSETDLKTALQKLESQVEELGAKIGKNKEKLEEKESSIKTLEEKVRQGDSDLTLAKHGFELKENELKTSNKQLTTDLNSVKIDYEKSATERDILKNQLVEMEKNLRQAEEIGTASANEQINHLNQKIGELDSQLKIKQEEQEEVSKKLRDSQEETRKLELQLEKESQVQKMRETAQATDTDHMLENISQKDEQIKDLQVEIGELEEQLRHAETRSKDIQQELNDTNRLILDKNGALLTNAEQDQVREKYVNSLETQLQKEREKSVRSNHDLEMLKCKFDHLTEDNKSLENQLEQMEERLEMRDQSVSQVNEKLTETRKTLIRENDKSRDDLKRKNEALQEHISELRQNLVSAEAAKDMTEIEINRLKQEVKQQASSLRVKEDMFKQQKTVLEAKNTELGEEVKKIEKKLQELYTDRLHLKNDLSNTKDKLEEEETEKKELERKIESLSLSNSTLSNEMIEVKGNLDREEQNKGHYQELYKAEQEYSKQLKNELSEAKRNISSLESLNDTMKNTVDEFKDSHREEKTGRTLAAKELNETRMMLENEIKTRSHIGTRITNLERENQDLANELHNEQKKAKKAQQARKVSEASVEALQQNLTDLHKDIAELKDQLMFTQKAAEEGKIKEQKYNALKGKVQRDKQAQRRRVEDLERTLEEAQESIRKEGERRGEAEGNYLILKNEVQALQTKIAQLQTESNSNNKARQNAEVRAQQLQMELSGIHNKIGSELVTREELESVRKQAEGRARIELNRKLEEINAQLEEQSKARGVIDTMRSENEEKMRRGFEKTASELKRELTEAKQALTKDQVNASSLENENKMIKGMLEREQQRRKQLEMSLEDTHRELQKSRDLDLRPLKSDSTPNLPFASENNKNFNSPGAQKHYSDPSETLARMKARLNQSINKYLDEKINNDGSMPELYTSTSGGGAGGGGDQNLSPRTELQRSGRTSPSPRYMSIMKSNYYL